MGHKGFTLIETLLAILFVSVAIAISMNWVSYSGMVAQKGVEENLSTLNDLEMSLTTYNSVGNGYPVDTNNDGNLLDESGFQPFLSPMVPSSVIDPAYGSKGFILSSSSQGWYVCMSFVPAAQNGVVKQVITGLEGKLPPEHFFYGASCPLVTNGPTVPDTASVIGTYWIQRN